MSYQNISCPDPMQEEQNWYDNGWYDGVQFGLTMKDCDQGILPEENQDVLIWLNGIYIQAKFQTLCYQQLDGQFRTQKMFVTASGKEFIPGYVKYWMPLPMFPPSNMYQ